MWAIKKLNFDFTTAKEERLLQLSELEELRNEAVVRDQNAYTNGWHYHQRTIILILSNSSNNLLI